ncbi:hypothetical protein JYU34_019848 [Plutella xylostella]|uniref:Uncharacterized protein n=1 Tax=Plutella xylostella TaxID=51655 RepID=A0ABQ7PVN3_PLUXY|nr:hypothetical protein JYU34_019848 [Plutella xylostella]
MDNASDYGSEDSRFESWQGRMFGMLNVPQTSGKILRYPGPSRMRGHAFMVPPQQGRFETLKKLVRQEHLRELQRQYETEQKQELKELARGNDDYAYTSYSEQEPRGLQGLGQEYPADEPAPRHLNRKPPSPGSRQVSQFSRYSDVLVPSRRSLHPVFDYPPELIPYLY